MPGIPGRGCFGFRGPAKRAPPPSPERMEYKLYYCTPTRDSGERGESIIDRFLESGGKAAIRQRQGLERVSMFYRALASWVLGRAWLGKNNEPISLGDQHED